MERDVVKQIERSKIIAILRGIEPEQTVRVCQALLEGGVTVAELTFDQTGRTSTEQTAVMIAAARGAFGDRMAIGAGTVVRLDQAEAAASAGAQFFVTPNTDADIIRFARERDIATVVGAMTATECQYAHTLGADFVKLFPAEPLGPAYMKALRAPLGHIRFLAVGGVDQENAAAFLAAGAAGVGIGSCLVDPKEVRQQQFEGIRRRAAALVERIGGERA